MIIINFKNYLHQKKFLDLVRIIEKNLSKAIIAVPALEAGYLYRNTKLIVFVQHVDCVEGKRATGFVLPEAVKSYGVNGTLLNHSEHKLPYEILKKSIFLAHLAGLKVVLCCENIEEAVKFKKLKPYAIAFEDKKLVGTKKSITKYRQNDVKNFAKIFSDSEIIPLCGAGINSIDDVKKAYDLGCKGVLISSAIANASFEKAKRFLKELSVLK